MIRTLIRATDKTGLPAQMNTITCAFGIPGYEERSLSEPRNDGMITCPSDSFGRFPQPFS